MRACRLLMIVLLACGSNPKPAPIENTAKPGAEESSGAGQGKTIQRTSSGGVLELTGDRDKAMEQGAQEMAAHCGKDSYMIVQEGEEATGSGATVWRVHYQCNK